MNLRLTSLLAASVVLAACGINPVTGERELQLVSQAQELQIGEQQYAPARQSQGGDFNLLPEISAYVSEVGQKLAAVSDRPLPYEFEVLNSSVPNAWALPGGKIAVNRGLLTELESEAELAAVLGHEIVHAAARHGAKAQERGTLLQVGVMAVGLGAAMTDIDSNFTNLMVGSAVVGAHLISTRYGRDAELESDLYGMRYMQRAGYDPSAAVSLQEKFVRLAEQDGRSQGWLDGLFASHPPARERVEQNRRTAAALGAGGEVGAGRYAERIAPLRAMQPAYENYDEAVAAARKKQFTEARRLAIAAARKLPQEGRFQQLLGDLEMAEKRPADAIAHYEKAVSLDPGYYGPYLSGGVAWYETGETAKAEGWLKKSVELLPTAPAHYYLGAIARDAGRMDEALAHYRTAAGARGELGQQAAVEYVAIDLARNPGQYVATAAGRDARGRVLLRLENRAPITVADIGVTPVLIDGSGRIVQEGRSLRIGRELGPGEQLAVDAGVGALADEQMPYLRFRIDAARAVRR